MANEEEKYFKELDFKIENLRKRGLELGLSEKEIDICMIQATKQRINHKEDRTLFSLLMRFLKYSFFICAILFLLVITFSFVVTHNKGVQLFMGRVLAPYGYTIFRAIRLAFLPVTKNTNITRFYEEECLIYNPYFRVPETSCELCSYVKEIEERSQYADLDVNNPAQPFINRQALGQPVTFEDLRTAYKENAEKLQASVMNFRSNEMSLRSFKDLFAVNSPVELQKQIGDMFHTEYVSRKVAGAQVLRRLFHRPHFVPAETEVALEKFVFVDGPKAKPYKFSLAQFSNVWYAQGQGSRRLILLPSVNCLGECKKFEITLKERDILFYSDEFWRASSYPVPQSQEISIAFKGSFF